MEIIGVLSTICFGICAVPQAWQAYRTKRADDINSTFLILWTIGEIGAIIYQYHLNGFIIFHYQYILNLICIVIIGWYKYRRVK